jgi:hypothetical protein
MAVLIKVGFAHRISISNNKALGSVAGQEVDCDVMMVAGNETVARHGDAPSYGGSLATVFQSPSTNRVTF